MSLPPTAAGETRTRSRWRSLLLSGLVLPGLGQLVSGYPLRGLVFAGGTVVGLVVLVRRVVQETLARLPEDPATIDPLLPLRLAHEIHRDNAWFFVWLTAVLLGLWVASIVDAWHTSRSASPAATAPRQSSAPRQ